MGNRRISLNRKRCLGRSWSHRPDPCQRGGRRFRGRFRGVVQVLLGALEGLFDAIEAGIGVDRLSGSVQ
jgi:hypothetical protein